ncbi:hypothetical protein AVEN_170091-1 [Araneus ventricosus]|uniref:Uncharacterized protein n=1 Tax=Araneus ventricosus TaxID=182803 RepID=A0A4Y2M6L3_ARAVE|nr:hypothetical protein AVEN_170091-1 [Araneus ventricosus]
MFTCRQLSSNGQLAPAVVEVMLKTRRFSYLWYLEETQQVGHLDRSDARSSAQNAGDPLVANSRGRPIWAAVGAVVDIADGT